MIEVGCAIIYKEGKILIAQRKPGGPMGGYWEFPGGKHEPGESLQDCLVREVREELGVVIQPERLIHHAVHTYPERTLKLYFVLCRFLSGRPLKLDCYDFRWIKPAELRNFRFPPADDEVIGDLIRNQFEYFGRG